MVCKLHIICTDYSLFVRKKHDGIKAFNLTDQRLLPASNPKVRSVYESFYTLAYGKCKLSAVITFLLL